MTFDDVETERMRRRITVARLAQAAGMSARTVERYRSGVRVPSAATLARLQQGLYTLARDTMPGAKLNSRLVFRMLVGHIALISGLDPKAVLAADPAQKATANAEWKEASRIRDFAIYLLHTVIGMPNAEIARAAGVTAAAITMALYRMEDRRDRPALNQMLELCEEAVRG